MVVVGDGGGGGGVHLERLDNVSEPGAERLRVVLLLLAPLGASVLEPDAHLGLGQTGPGGDLLAGRQVRVAVARERGLQLLQLLAGEVGALAARPLLLAARVALLLVALLLLAPTLAAAVLVAARARRRVCSV